MTDDTEATYTYVGALVDELARAGVRYACLCPGSRSTPLALTLEAHPGIQTFVHVDERSCAFFALGLAKALGRPTILACTSGTAAANFMPAVVEAHYGRTGLIVLTADRPAELRDNGAAQTIDQINLYGRHVKWFVDMPTPMPGQGLERFVRATAARAAATALQGPAGPVHLNLPFREPLVPALSGAGEGASSSFVLAGVDLTGSRHPHVAVVEEPRLLTAEDATMLATLLSGHPRGVIICGAQSDLSLSPELVKLARALGYPILADPLSGLRCGPHDHALICDAYDAFLRADPVPVPIPEVVLRVGAIPTSKALLTFAEKAAVQIVVDGDGGWLDPSSRADTIVHADPFFLCAPLIAALEAQGVSADAAWGTLWRRVDRAARETIEKASQEMNELFEGRVYIELAKVLPDGATVFVGNSMPVRDLDTFFPGSEKRIRFMANRGANGIDGVVSSALGAAAQLRGDGPLVLVIGDLSFYHDLNGLLAARLYDLDATIVLINNDGGGIFSFLPQSAYPDRFEKLFGTPTGLDFSHAARLYDCDFARSQTWADFRTALGSFLDAQGVRIVEVRTDRARNVVLHRSVLQAVAGAVTADRAKGSS